MKIAAILFLLYTTLGMNVDSYCKCDEDESLAVAVEKSDLVIVGEVIGKTVISKGERDAKGKKHNLKLISYKVKIKEAYKGVRKDKTVVIYTLHDDAACELILEFEQNHVIFARRGTYLPEHFEFMLDEHEKRAFWSNSCSKTIKHNPEIEKTIENLVNQP